MRSSEARIEALLRAHIRGRRPKGSLRCSATDGSIGFTGAVETGLLFRQRQEILDLLDPAPEPDLSDLLFELRKASRARPEGPWYCCHIEIDGGDMRFRYAWENAPFASIKELEPDMHGHVPSFVFRRRFDRALIDELSDFEVGSALLFYVPARIEAGKPVSGALLDLYATLDWQSDVNNGALDQYFARDRDPMTGLPRGPLYAATLRGLRVMGHEVAAALFAEAIALYAHFHARVEEARVELGIAPVPRQEESDIMGRYYDLNASLDAARTVYIRAHAEALEQR